MEFLHSAETLNGLAEAVSLLAKQQSDMLQCIAGLTALQKVARSPAIENESDAAQILPDEGGGEVSKLRERVKVGTDANGSPIYKWACGNTRDELHQAISKLLGNGGSPQTDAGSTPKWTDYSAEWYDTFHRHKILGNTEVKTRYLMAKHVQPLFAGKRVGEISVKDVQEALYTKSQYSKSYVRDIMNLASQVFDAALDDGYLARNPMDSARVVNTGTKKTEKRKALSREEQADIIRNMDRLTNDSDRRFMAFLMYTCMRPGEIYGLRWEDIDLERDQIHIQRDLVFAGGRHFFHDCKNEGSQRYIPIDPELKRRLAPYQKEGYVICRQGRGHDGEHHTETSAKRSWQRIKQTIDVHGMTPYVGRHTFATNMSKAGVPLRTAISLMGQADERMLMRHYVHTDEEDIVNAGIRMSSFINGIEQERICD